MYRLESEMGDITNKSSVRSMVHDLLRKRGYSAGTPGHKSVESIIENINPLFYRDPINREATAAAVILLIGYNNTLRDGVSYGEWWDFSSKIASKSDKSGNYQSHIKDGIEEVREDMKQLGMNVPSEKDVLYTIIHRMGYELTGIGRSNDK